MKPWAEALCWNTMEMESSLGDLRPQSCSEHWKVYFNRGQRISSSRKSHSGTSSWPLLLASLVLCWAVTRDSGSDCMRSALVAPELSSKHSAVWRRAERMSKVMNEWSPCCLVVSCWMLWLREPGLCLGGQEARSGELADFSNWRLSSKERTCGISKSLRHCCSEGTHKGYGWASVPEPGAGPRQGKQAGRSCRCCLTVWGEGRGHGMSGGAYTDRQEKYREPPLPFTAQLRAVKPSSAEVLCVWLLIIQPCPCSCDPHSSHY